VLRHASSLEEANAMINWTEVIRRSNEGNPAPSRTVEKPDAEWRAQLSPEQYQVTRQAATERPFSSEMCSKFEPGSYACACCGELLFDGQHKFESGTGWPSFSLPAADNAIAYVMDSSHGMRRVETVCNACKAHLGHIFPDGPAPTGLRYCMNALALSKVHE
jgi:methionine-R-sulfoxide reductase